MTSYTMIQTLNLIEKLQLKSTLDNISKISGFSASDVATSLSLNLANLVVTPSDETTYVLAHTQASRDTLRAQGKLLEMYDYVDTFRHADGTTEPSHHTLAIIRNYNNSSFLDPNNPEVDPLSQAIDAYNTDLSNSGSDKIALNYEWASTYTDPVLGTDVFIFYLGIFLDAGINEETVYPYQIEAAKTLTAPFGIVYSDDVTVLESQWVKAPNSLI